MLNNSFGRGCAAMGAAAAVIAATSAAGATTCNINFNSLSALTAMPDNKAGNTFAFAPWYNHPCTSSQFLVTEGVARWNHYHLSFESPCVGGETSACFVNGYFGLNLSCAGSGTGCAAINAARYARFLSSMSGGQVISIVGAPNPGQYCVSDGCVATSGKIFSATSVTVKSGSAPIRITMLQISTTTIQTPGGPKVVPIKVPGVFGPLGPGTWTLNSAQADQALISGWNGDPGGNFSFDNFAISY